MIGFISVKQLSQDVLKLIPFCIDKRIGAIAGVPRSGMLPATLLANHLHVPLLVKGAVLHGNRLQVLNKRGTTERILVLDDTAGTGASLQKTCDCIHGHYPAHEVYKGAVYITPGLESSMDIYGVALKEWPRLFEWNFMNNDWTQKMMFDMDGVMCVDPPPERDEAAYVAYITDAIPKYIPSFPAGWICTYRLENRRKITEAWLQKHMIEVKHEMIMAPYETPEARKELPKAVYKARAYVSARTKGCILFIESHDDLAAQICEISLHPVLSLQSMRLFTR